MTLQSNADSRIIKSTRVENLHRFGGWKRFQSCYWFILIFAICRNTFNFLYPSIQFYCFFFFLTIGKKLISTRFFALSIFNFSGWIYQMLVFIFQKKKKNSYTIINIKNFLTNCKSQIVFILSFSPNPIPLLLPITYKTFSKKRWKRDYPIIRFKITMEKRVLWFSTRNFVSQHHIVFSSVARRSEKFHWNSMCFTVAYSCQCILSWTF